MCSAAFAVQSPPLWKPVEPSAGVTHQMSNDSRTPVLIAGVGGASLGTELAKSLDLTDRYAVFGCDISPYAFGHFSQGFVDTALVEREDYVAGVLDACRRFGTRYVVPGGEQPMVLLNAARGDLERAGVRLLANSSATIDVCSDKAETFTRLKALGVRIPRTVLAPAGRQLDEFPLPVIVKATTGTGGSSLVFLAATRAEVPLYVDHIRACGREAILQEYVAHDEGEYTIGVLSLPDGRVAASVALRRMFHVKLSVAQRSEAGLISSGYSQGLIDDFPALRATAEEIAAALGSTGPLNIQGRVRDGALLPFEINPRFSASTHLRAMAGVNELDIYLQFLERGTVPPPPTVAKGYYLRSLAEVYVPPEQIEV